MTDDNTELYRKLGANRDAMAKAMLTGHEVAIDDLRREYDQLTNQKQEDNR